MRLAEHLTQRSNVRCQQYLRLVGGYPTCSVLALKGCEGLWTYDEGYASLKYTVFSPWNPRPRHSRVRPSSWSYSGSSDSFSAAPLARFPMTALKAMMSGRWAGVFYKTARGKSTPGAYNIEDGGGGAGGEGRGRGGEGGKEK